LARYNSKGYIAPSAIHHPHLQLGNVFIDDRVVIFQDNNGGPVESPRSPV